VAFLQPGDQLEAIAVWQSQVGEAQGEGCRRQRFFGCGQRMHCLRGYLHALQGDTEQLAQVRLVVDDEN
jgi:hypothetical protein